MSTIMDIQLLVQENDLLNKLNVLLMKYRCFVIEKCVCIDKNNNGRELFDCVDKRYQDIRSQLNSIRDGNKDNPIDNKEVIDENSQDEEMMMNELNPEVKLEEIHDPDSKRRRKRKNLYLTKEVISFNTKTKEAILIDNNKMGEEELKFLEGEDESEIGTRDDNERTHDGRKLKFCIYKDCGFKTPRSTILEGHVNSVHIGIKPYSCDDCDKGFYASAAFKAHKERHQIPKSIPCSWKALKGEKECKRKFRKHYALEYHIKKDHEKEWHQKCEWPGCDFEASMVESGKMVVHMRSHTGELPFKCDYEGCSSAFVAKGSLMSHVTGVHQKLRKFVCDWPGCDEKFCNKVALVGHQMSRHTGEKPMICDWPGCDFRTHRTEIFRDHRTIHTGEKNFVCTECGNKFATRKYLARHKSQHKPDKKFKCEYPGCEKAFAGSEQIYQHRLRVHNKVKKVKTNQ